MILTAPLAALGRSTLALLASIGRVAIYAAQVLRHVLTPPWYPREFAMQVLQIGWLSLPVVGLTALFTGGALALQIYAGGSRFNAETVVPSRMPRVLSFSSSFRPTVRDSPGARGSGDGQPISRVV